MKRLFSILSFVFAFSFIFFSCETFEEVEPDYPVDTTVVDTTVVDTTVVDTTVIVEDSIVPFDIYEFATTTDFEVGMDSVVNDTTYVVDSVIYNEYISYNYYFIGVYYNNELIYYVNFTNETEIIRISFRTIDENRNITKECVLEYDEYGMLKSYSLVEYNDYLSTDISYSLRIEYDEYGNETYRYEYPE